MTKKLTDEERLSRRTCPRCGTVYPKALREGLCKPCIAEPEQDVITVYYCPTCEEMVSGEPGWCPNCKTKLTYPDDYCW